MNTKMKGAGLGSKKILALAAVFAMVACALCVIAPVADVDAAVTPVSGAGYVIDGEEGTGESASKATDIQTAILYSAGKASSKDVANVYLTGNATSQTLNLATITGTDGLSTLTTINVYLGNASTDYNLSVALTGASAVALTIYVYNTSSTTAIASIGVTTATDLSETTLSYYASTGVELSRTSGSSETVTTDISGLTATGITLSATTKAVSSALSFTNSTVSSSMTITSGDLTVSGGTISGDITTAGAVTVKDKATISGDITSSSGVVTLTSATIASGATLTISGGSMASVATATINGTIDLTGGSLDIKSSTVLTGDGSITVNGGTVNIKVTSSSVSMIPIVARSGTVTIGGDSSGTNYLNGRVTITGTADLTISGAFTISDKAKLTVSNESTGSYAGSSAITVIGTLAATTNYAAKTLAGTSCTVIYGTNSNGKYGVVENSAAETAVITSGGLTTTSTNADQNFQIDGSITISSATTIGGVITVAEGVTLTITDAGQLALTGIFAKIINNGTIVIENDSTDSSGIELTKGVIYNYGTISVDCSADDEVIPGLVIGTEMCLVNEGVITVEEGSSISIAADATVDNKDTITIGGTVTDSGIIKNAGTITFDEAILKADVTISLASTSAVVDIQSYSTSYDAVSSGTVTTTRDAGATITVKDDAYDASNLCGTDEDPSSIVIGATNDSSTASAFNLTVSGLTVGLTTVKCDATHTGSTTTKYLKTLVLSGDVSVSDNLSTSDSGDSTAYIYLAGDAVVSGALNIDDYVTFYIGNAANAITALTTANAGYLSVSGVITSTEDSKVTFGNTATDGDGSTITVTGSLTVFNTISTVGSGTSAQVLSAAMYEVARSGDVKKHYVYTNLADAVGAAPKTIDVTGEITVDSTLTVPSGTTVKVASGAMLTIDDDAIVTFASGSFLDVAADEGQGVDVDGVLILEAVKDTLKKSTANIMSDVVKDNDANRIYSNATYAISNASSGDTITLNGTWNVKSNTTIPEGVTVDTKTNGVTVAEDITLTIAGTLYLSGDDAALVHSADDAKIILNGTIKYSEAAKAISDIPGAYYTITADNVLTNYIQPVALAATNVMSADDYTITLKNEISAGSFSVTGTTDNDAIVEVEGKLTAGTITLAYAQVKFDNGMEFSGTIANANGSAKLAGTATSSVTVSSDDDGVLTVAGTFTAENSKVSDIVLAGAVTARGTLNYVTVDGTVTVNGTSSTPRSLTATKMIVNGTLSLGQYGSSTVETISVLGTVSGDGTLNAETAYIGISEEDATGADATVSSAFNLTGSAIVMTGSNVPSTLSDATVYDTTVYYVDDAIYATGYALAGASDVMYIVDFVPTIDSGIFDTWYDGDDEVSTTAKIGDVDTVTADVEYKIYYVSISAVKGISDVYIGGVLATYYNGQFIVTTLTAGTYTVTATIASGYTGTPALYTTDGTAVSGNSITLSGNESTDRFVYYQLTGVTVDTSGDDSGETKDDGMSITDILLIILVVLIAIMAIVIAARLLRS